jgi:hypothetical protein
LLAVLLLTLGDGVLGVVGFGGRFGDLFVAGIVERWAEAHVDRETLAGATFVYAADRGDVAVVAAVGDANVAKLDGFA